MSIRGQQERTELLSENEWTLSVRGRRRSETVEIGKKDIAGFGGWQNLTSYKCTVYSRLWLMKQTASYIMERNETMSGGRY